MPVQPTCSALRFLVVARPGFISTNREDVKVAAVKNFKPHVVQDQDQPIEKDILAQAIVDISESAKALTASGLNERAIVVLLHDHTGIPMGDIKMVLHGIGELRKAYTTR